MQGDMRADITCGDPVALSEINVISVGVQERAHIDAVRAEARSVCWHEPPTLLKASLDLRRRHWDPVQHFGNLRKKAVVAALGLPLPIFEHVAHDDERLHLPSPKLLLYTTLGYVDGSCGNH